MKKTVTGEMFKDAGISLVMTNCKEEWKAQAMVLVDEFLLVNDEFMGEDVSHYIVSRIGKPHHPNVLSAVFCTAIARSGKAIPVGIRKASNPQARAHFFRVWKKVPG